MPNLTYASRRGHALLDRELSLPQDWTDDRVRCQAAGIPETVPFATKPELARRMIERAMQHGVPFAWISGDTVYGGDPAFRQWLEDHQVSFVLAVAKDDRLWDGARHVRADELAANLPSTAWQQLSCGQGANGPRLYDWALRILPRVGQPATRFHALLVRRSLSDGELAYFSVYAPAATPLQTLVNVAGQRWTVEECFELGKDEVGLDQYEVRHWIGWYRHITLAMRALAYLTVTRCQAGQPILQKNDGSLAEGLLPLTVCEIRRLLWRLLWKCAPLPALVLAWSRWRRRHQFRAMTSHYRRRQAILPP